MLYVNDRQASVVIDDTRVVVFVVCGCAVCFLLFVVFVFLCFDFFFFVFFFGFFFFFFQAEDGIRDGRVTGVQTCAFPILRICPMPSISVSTISPALRYSGGLRAKPTPLGVPVAMISPGSSVMPCERMEIIVLDRKSTRLNSSHPSISYAVFCLKKKNKHI